MPSGADEVIGLATRRNQLACDDQTGRPIGFACEPVAGVAPAKSHDITPPARRLDRVGGPAMTRRQGEPAEEHGHLPQPKLASTLTETTPTHLPELLRNFSQQAGRLASHPFNAFDNNPFIIREWLIVSQVLHAAANTLEQRFEALFLGV
jgi:hypothetical protein